MHVDIYQYNLAGSYLITQKFVMFASDFFKCEVLKPLSIKSTAIIQSRGLNLSSLAKYTIYPKVCVLVCVRVCVVSQFKDHDYIDFKRGPFPFHNNLHK